MLAALLGRGVNRISWPRAVESVALCVAYLLLGAVLSVHAPPPLQVFIDFAFICFAVSVVLCVGRFVILVRAYRKHR